MTKTHSFASPATARASPALKGVVAAPGDKSVSHRALILAGLAAGESRIAGLLEAEDVLRTAAALRSLGVDVEREGGDAGPIWRVRGGMWRRPDRPLYFGNSGTGCRLMMGAVAGAGVAAAFDGDGSLRHRPMGRVIEPLLRMGVKASLSDGKLPVVILNGGRPTAIEYALPAPSAQIKSAVLLAALGANGETVVREPVPCRDHTERILPAFGASIAIEGDGAGGKIIRLKGPQRLSPARIDVSGDPSSSAFLVAAALIVPGSDILVENVLVNSTRAGFYETVREMGADVRFENARHAAGEPVADIGARYSALRGVEVPAFRAPSMIDEYPILAVLAAFADGQTRMAGIGEMRVKESDRIAVVEAGLAANGVKATSGPDWLAVDGRRGGVAGGGRVETQADHRVAMSFLVMGLASQKPVEIDDSAMIATSFPSFFGVMAKLGAAIEVEQA